MDLKTVLGNALKLLHPFMPFITEEIYCTLNPEEDSIMIAAWPKETEDFAYAEDEAAVEMMKEAVRSIRGVRTSMNVPPSKKASVFVVTEDAAVQETFKMVLYSSELWQEQAKFTYRQIKPALQTMRYLQ